MTDKTSKTEMEITMQVMNGWYMQFCETKYYSKLKKKAQKHSENIILDLLSLMFYEFDLRPDDWTDKALDEFCHEKLSGERYYRGGEYFESASQVLLAFFQYLDSMKFHKNANVLIETIKEHSSCILDSYHEMEEDDEDDGEQYDQAQEITEKWLKKFIKTKHFSELEKKYQENSKDIISTFSEMMYSYTGSKIEKWDTSGLEEICLDVMPRKVMANELYFESITPSLHAFFLFMKDEKINKNATKLAERIKIIEKDIIKTSKKPSKWGIGKQILSQALDKGIDISDQSKLSKFLDSIMGKALPNSTYEDEEEIESINSYGTMVPFVRKTEKIGRNDPCTCGSGKKYKKCCGK